MSLIHDALKKAAPKEKPDIGSGVMSIQEAALAPKKGVPRRTIALVVILAVALSAFMYLRLKPKATDQGLAPKPMAASGSENLSKGDIGMLKKKAMDAYRMEDLNTAWTTYSTASDLDSSDAEVWNNLGVVARKRGDIAMAEQDYTKALEFKAEYPEALNNLAVIRMQQERNTEAIDYLTKALSLSPAYPEANFNMALLYDKKGDKQKASEYYRRFLDVGGSFSSSVIDSIRDRLMELEK